MHEKEAMQKLPRVPAPPALLHLPGSARPQLNAFPFCRAHKSNGVLEAQDDREALYGEERLRELLLQSAREGLDAEALVERLFWDVGRFQASAGQRDDIKAIAVRVTGA